MSGFQEIAVIVLIALAVLVLPRMTAKRSDIRPAAPPLPRISARFSGRMRLAVAASAVWLLGWAVYLEPWSGDILAFLRVGMLPVIVGWIVGWVVAGFRKGRRF